MFDSGVVSQQTDLSVCVKTHVSEVQSALARADEQV